MGTTNYLGVNLESPTYTPNKLLNAVMARLGMKFDIELCTMMDVEGASISRMRNRKTAISPFVLVRLCDVSGLTVKEARALAGIPAPEFHDQQRFVCTHKEPRRKP